MTQNLIWFLIWQYQCGKTNKRFDQNDEISRNLSVRGEEEDICRLEARNVESVIWLRCVRCRQVNLDKCLDLMKNLKRT